MLIEKATIPYVDRTSYYSLCRSNQLRFPMLIEPTQFPMLIEPTQFPMSTEPNRFSYVDRTKQIFICRNTPIAQDVLYHHLPLGTLVGYFDFHQCVDHCTAILQFLVYGQRSRGTTQISFVLHGAPFCSSSICTAIGLGELPKYLFSYSDFKMVKVWGREYQFFCSSIVFLSAVLRMSR